ncbi:hypothetical protein Ahy_B05g075184 [Arachis hypogaea]|uniref:Profilin n=1 Tax=Arachis hypogaea TaxID=3818 RepID=A0A444Z0R3_ARAHY|nr:hypothetical protein Ahy_B05g075184 [Arachis hypogaea]
MNVIFTLTLEAVKPPLVLPQSSLVLSLQSLAPPHRSHSSRIETTIACSHSHSSSRCLTSGSSSRTVVLPLVHPLASLSSRLHRRLLADSIVCSSHGLVSSSSLVHQRQNLGGGGGAPQYIQSNVNANNQNLIAEEEETVQEFMVKEISKTQESNSSRSTMELGTSSNQNVPRDVAQPIIGHPSNHCSAAQLKGTEDVFISDKGDISFDELNEALMLEAALFGETPNHSSERFKPEEITAIMNDFVELGSLAPTALYLGGTKYMVIQGEPRAVIREKKSTKEIQEVTISISSKLERCCSSLVLLLLALTARYPSLVIVNSGKYL